MVTLGQRLYGVDLSRVEISFDLRGRAAGYAHWTGSGPNARHKVRFNRDMLTREAFDHVLNDTVPHEYAHIICAIDPRLGRNHNEGWARVCRAMGGGGARCHNEEVVHGKGYTYEYVTDRGHKVRVGDKHHRYIQAGGKLTYRKGKGAVLPRSGHTIVGYQGRTLTNPIVRQPAQGFIGVAPTQPVVQPVQQRPAVYTPTPAAPRQQPTFAGGQSKASISRSIMLSGYRAGQTYEAIIAAMIAANGYDRQLARATFKANAAKVGVPINFYS
jgi:predicted SprT family Zn-dependent metalloprotease